MDALGCVTADAAAIAAAAAAAPASPVASCPGWTLTDLADHVAGVFGFATASLLAVDGVRPPRPAPGPLDSALATLLDTIEAVGPVAERPTLLGPRPAAWWVRRMHHELAVHRVDASPGVAPTWIGADCAVDGIDELSSDLLPVAAKGGPFPPTTVRFGDVAVVRFDADGARPGSGDTDVAIEGDPVDLFLLLWGRRSLDGLTVAGDRSVAEATVGALRL
jgi:uncharacterized protein (TIGR03083 family)